jgi:hypothetical protein
MEARPRRRRWLHILVAVLVILIVVLASLQLAGLLDHTVCQTTPVDRKVLWTPLALLNSPYSSVVPLPNGSVVAERLETVNGKVLPVIAGALTAVNGESVGLFSRDIWVIDKQQNSTVWGAGSTNSCSGSYGAEDLGPVNALTLSVNLLPLNSTNDSNEPWQIYSGGYGSVVFYNGLPGDSSVPGQWTISRLPDVSSCNGGGPLGFGNSFNTATVGVPYVLNGQNMTISASYTDMLSYEYFVGPDSGSWEIYEPPTGGFAFNHAPCPP